MLGLALLDQGGLDDGELLVSAPLIFVKWTWGRQFHTTRDDKQQPFQLQISL